MTFMCREDIGVILKRRDWDILVVKYRFSQLFAKKNPECLLHSCIFLLI
jgi:hypothetical protein